MAIRKRKAESVKGNDFKRAKESKLGVDQSTPNASKDVNDLEMDDSSEAGLDNLTDNSISDITGADNSESEPELLFTKAKDFTHKSKVEKSKGAASHGSSSKEAHAKQKHLIAERKAGKPLADQLARTKKIWERLRRKSHVPLEERKALIMELFEIITGKMKDYVLKHDSVRVVQTAVKYANLDQRRLIARELKGTYRQLAESRYAKFLIGKLLARGDDEIRDLIIPEFFGCVRRLIRHPEASWILDDVYRGIATKKQKAIILREWYGPEFAIFQDNSMENISGDLADVLAKDIAKRAPIMRSLHELINNLIQKKMTGFTLLHDAMLQYFLNAKPGTEEVTDFIELIKGDEDGDLLKNLAFTRSGSRIVCLALAYGTAKDRRQILKGYKDTIQLMASDPNAYMIILTAYDVIDDTVLTTKSIFPELLGKDTEKQVENIIYLANNMIGRITLLYLFQGRSASLFPPNLSADLAFLSEIDSIRTTSSKKDPNTRQKELAKALHQPLIGAVASSSADLVTTPFGCQFITAVLFSAEGDKIEALKAVASTAAGDPNIRASPSEALNTSTHIAASSYGGKMLKSLVVGGPYDKSVGKIVPTSPPLKFADTFYPVIKNHLVGWATGPSSYVVLRLFEAEDFSFKEDAIELLRQGRKLLVKASKEGPPEQKARTAGDHNVKAKRKGGKKTVLKDGETGNGGARLLLGLLN